MEAKELFNILDSKFYTGVPDSLLRPMCDCIMDEYELNPKHHIIAANEGNAVALAAGYYLSTGKTAVCYMQNSGEGNAVNPIASLLNDKVYGIPVIFVIGWRGEPGVHDEPQHAFQGEITTKLLDVMDTPYFIIGKETEENEVCRAMDEFRGLLSEGKQVAFVVKKGALSNSNKRSYSNNNEMTREEAIECIAKYSGVDAIISTTGKASRELFEIREKNEETHGKDFLTVGSMGHASSIALSIALQKPDKRIWCIDGDGAAIMHMGAMAVIGECNPNNLIHIVINNAAHESVGGLPTAGGRINLCEIAKASGYNKAFSVNTREELEKVLKDVKETNELTFIEVKAKIGSRADLGRPTTSAKENKEAFISYLNDWDSFIDGINGLSDDFMADGRLNDFKQKREEM